jgi:RNA polymerase sigma factor (TIGR02999 family)
LALLSFSVIFGGMSEVTRALAALSQGDPHAASQLLPLVYDELRRLAAQKLAHEAPGQTLQATALVHEAYLRLVGNDEEAHWDNRRHFFAAAAEAMRRILVENVRRKRSRKHGGGLQRQDAEEVQLAAPEPIEDLLALDEALGKLSAKDPLKAELVKLRYFAGMTIDEAAGVLGISVATAKRYWSYTRAWLYQEMTGEPPESSVKPS